MNAQMELFNPAEITTRKRPEGRKTATTTDITLIDCVRGRAKCGECEDDNGVSFWDIIECLKRDGVRDVQFI